MVDQLVNGIGLDGELSDEFSSEDEYQEGGEVVAEAREGKHGKTLAQAYVQYELQAVMRIKLQFFKWFEDFFKKTKDIFLGNVG